LAESAEKDIFVPVDLPHLRTAIETLPTTGINPFRDEEDE
jgi:hypothetical protein